MVSEANRVIGENEIASPKKKTKKNKHRKINSSSVLAVRKGRGVYVQMIRHLSEGRAPALDEQKENEAFTRTLENAHAPMAHITFFFKEKKKEKKKGGRA